ncbi:phosphatase PAP2 family protein [Salinisphaera sp.]|uniref:phosphatase PAP2 family protein n=1 Tax=Salinisphaera sp. TaxID=1914330 RepID=UPI000C4F25D5|nr:phosphatase PAP2 family protein [Salinisphaera sp.]MBS63720.1 serine protease [Salinisphaera sp.]
MFVGALLITGCNGSSDDSVVTTSAAKPAMPTMPTGVGEEMAVDAPQPAYPLPSLRYASNNADGTLRWVIGDNPVPYALRGINDLWKGTSDAYQNAASGDGPDNYLDNPIVDTDVWAANMAYVLEVTQNRSDEEAILAFLDDTRSKNYSVIDGYGPLTESYVDNSGAYVDIAVPSVAQVLEDEHYSSAYNDNIRFAGDQTSQLGEVVRLVDAFRQRSPASTSASKYIFSTPRPWRMTDTGEIDFLGTTQNYACTDANGSTELRTVDQYTTNVDVVAGLMCARRAHSESHHEKGLYTPQTQNRRKDGGYPSGHTNAGYLAALAYAYALPQRYAEMLTRASQLGEDRIVAGMHSPVDVIGGRIHATMVASYALNQADIQAEATAAYNRAQQFFGQQAGAAGMSLYDYAHRRVEDEAGLIEGDNVRTQLYDTNRYDDYETNRQDYLFRMTYGLPQNEAEAGQAPEVPAGAEALLASRLPYLSGDQRRAVLYTTAIDSGYPILDDTNGWGRLNLFEAANGYGAFEGDVNVTMDADQGGFNAHDIWRNDIDGEGRLVKDGNGILELAGDNGYTGGTVVRDGTLAARSATAFGAGDVYVDGGTVAIDSPEPVAIAGNLTVNRGGLTFAMDAEARRLIATKTVYIEGGTLTLDFDSADVPAAGTQLTLLSGGNLAGRFARVDSGDTPVELAYSADSVIATVQ